MSETLSLLNNTALMLGALFTLAAGLVAWHLQRKKHGTPSMQSQLHEQMAQNPGRFDAALRPAKQADTKTAAYTIAGVAAEHVLHTRRGPPEPPGPPPVPKASRASDAVDDAVGGITDLL